MPIRCGIVGLPNVGKSTLFNALTRAQVPAENYPFCTIDPNVGVVPVPDPRLAQLAAIARPEKIVPTTVEFVDIAGLVAGASQGEGLGNQFLSHIREVDAIAHVVRCFESGDVLHVAGRIDPLSDVEIIDTELALADLATLEKGLDRATRAAKSGDQDAIRRRALFERAKAQAAGAIQTDFECGFIRAEVIAFPDYLAGKGEAGAREAGKLRLEGKEYLVQEGDVMHFRFNV